MKRGSSNNPRDKFSRSGGRGSSRISASAISRPGRRGSSNPSRFSKGGVYVPPIPVLLSGPDVTPGQTSAVFAWTLTEAGPAGYHRVRTRETEFGDNTVGDWSETANRSASETISGLDPEYQSYWYDIQSASDKDNEATFMDWTGGDPAYFNTTCSGTYGMANWNAEKKGSGKLTYLLLSWTTTVDMNYAQIDGAGFEASWNATGSPQAHSKMYTAFKFLDGTYQWRTRNRNRCNVWCGYSGWKYFSCSGGTINAQWE